MTSASILRSAISARTAAQRRSSSVTEIGLNSRSSIAMVPSTLYACSQLNRSFRTSPRTGAFALALWGGVRGGPRSSHKAKTPHPALSHNGERERTAVASQLSIRSHTNTKHMPLQFASPSSAAALLVTILSFCASDNVSVSRTNSIGFVSPTG